MWSCYSYKSPPISHANNIVLLPSVLSSLRASTKCSVVERWLATVWILRPVIEFPSKDRRAAQASNWPGACLAYCLSSRFQGSPFCVQGISGSIQCKPLQYPACRLGIAIVLQSLRPVAPCCWRSTHTPKTNGMQPVQNTQKMSPKVGDKRRHLAAESRSGRKSIALRRCGGGGNSVLAALEGRTDTRIEMRGVRIRCGRPISGKVLQGCELRDGVVRRVSAGLSEDAVPLSAAPAFRQINHRPCHAMPCRPVVPANRASASVPC